MSRRSQRIERLARLREADVQRARSALADAARKENEAAERVAAERLAIEGDRRALAESQRAGSSGHALGVRALRLQALERRRDQAVADHQARIPETAARRRALVEARARHEGLERYAERLIDRERRELERREQRLADELGIRTTTRTRG